MQGDTEQRTGAYNVILRSIFIEVFERGQGSWNFLYFIKNQQRIVGVNFMAYIQLQAHN